MEYGIGIDTLKVKSFELPFVKLYNTKIIKAVSFNFSFIGKSVPVNVKKRKI